MHQLMVPHYKRVRGRLVYLGQQPVGTAAANSDEPDAPTEISLQRLKNDRNYYQPDVFVTKTDGAERHIYIYITNEGRRYR